MCSIWEKSIFEPHWGDFSKYRLWAHAWGCDMDFDIVRHRTLITYPLWAYNYFLTIPPEKKISTNFYHLTPYYHARQNRLVRQRISHGSKNNLLLEDKKKKWQKSSKFTLKHDRIPSIEAVQEGVGDKEALGSRRGVFLRNSKQTKCINKFFLRKNSRFLGFLEYFRSGKLNTYP